MNKSDKITSNYVEIIENQLYWISDRTPPKNQPNAYFFCIDQDLVYEPFFADFGPLDLGKTYRFVTELEKLLKDPNYLKYRIYHHTSIDTAKRTNAAYLMGAFQVIILGRTAEAAWMPFSKIHPPLADFRDASFGTCTYKCSILDCLKGLEYAIKLKWFDIRTFNLRDYEFYERIENGDMNWIIPGKFIAFSGPSSNLKDPDGWRNFTPEDYVPIFKRFDVNLVIRLNQKQYDSTRFTKNGINHMELYFLDGSCPNDDIVNVFLEAAEQEKNAIAVHCKAGLGRTGTLIALYAMKHYRFPAADFIGWIRICRPGSILGPQQQFLINKQTAMFRLGENSPIWKNISSKLFDKSSVDSLEAHFTDFNLKTKEEKATMSPQDKIIAECGDYGQANRLLSKKRMHGSPGSDKHNSPLPTYNNNNNSNSSFNNSLNNSSHYGYQPTSTNNTNASYSNASQSPISNHLNNILGNKNISTIPTQLNSNSGNKILFKAGERSLLLGSNERNKSHNSPKSRYAHEDSFSNKFPDRDKDKDKDRDRDKSFDIPFPSPNSYKYYNTKGIKSSANQNKYEAKSSPSIKQNESYKKQQT